MASLRFHLLGPLEAFRDGVKLDLGTRKQRAVLALLLLEANRVVSTERLIDELWGDSPPETARSALQVYVAGLRKALGDDSASLRTSAPGYMLELEPGALDLEEFAALRTEAREAAPQLASAALHDALALWRGPALAELDGEPFGVAAAARLEEQRLGALDERIDADLALGRHAELVPELDALVVDHPFRERFRARQMLALYRSGRQADALSSYRSAREAFVDALGIEPGAELKALERAMLDQDPALAAPLAAVRSAPARTVGRRRPRIAIAVLSLLSLVVVTVVAAFLLRGEPTPIAVPPNSVAVINPATNEVAAAVPVGIRPGAVVFGGGAIWVGILEDKSLTRIDPASRTVVRTVSLDATPTGVAFGARSVWVAHGLTGQLSRVDPQFGGIRTFDVARTSLRSISGGVATGARAVWVVYGDATFARLDSRSERVETSFAGARPTAVVEGGGAVWVVSSGDSTVYRFNPTTFLAGPIGRTNVGRRSTGIAFGHGAVWVTSSGDDVVTRIHPSTNSTLQIPVGDEPAAVAVGADAVWVANAGDGTVSRIDPRANEVVATIAVGHAPSGIAVGRGLVWTTLQAP